MFHGIYDHKDRYGRVYHLSCQIGGFKTEAQAIRAIIKRGGEGHTTDATNHILHVVRKGHVVNERNL